MTECPKCKGYGIVGSAVPDILRGRGAIFSSNECDMCHGSGEVPMTNEEYLRSCTTEQLAEFIADVCYGLLDDVWSNDGDTSCDYRETEKNYWVEWLKQPHTPKE